jgi:hypothetical protein
MTSLQQLARKRKRVLSLHENIGHSQDQSSSAKKACASLLQQFWSANWIFKLKQGSWNVMWAASISKSINRGRLTSIKRRNLHNKAIISQVQISFTYKVLHKQTSSCSLIISWIIIL